MKIAKKIKLVLMGVLMLFGFFSETSFAKDNEGSAISVALMGEMFNGGTPFVLLEYSKENKNIGINLSTTRWEREYPEYPSGYNKSNGRIYLVGARATYNLPWEWELNSKSKQKDSVRICLYAAGELNWIWIKTNWIKETTLQKAMLIGAELFPKRTDFSIIAEIAPAWLGEEEVKVTYNIGCKWYLYGGGEKK